MPIYRHRSTELNPVQAAFIEAACAYGLAYVADHNRPGAVGMGPMPCNAGAGVRMSTALTYLGAARGRLNGGWTPPRRTGWRSQRARGGRVQPGGLMRRCWRATSGGGCC